jgi:hypothetical protein
VLFTAVPTNMDDLAGINWSSSKTNPPNPSSTTPHNAFASLSLKPSPLSSRTASPAGASARQNGSATKKGPDSFASLVSFGRDKQNSNLSLLEQQKKLEEQRRQDEEERRRKMDALFGGNEGANKGFWDSLDGKGAGTMSSMTLASNDDDDDLLAAFNSSSPVDKRSHYPPPPSTSTPTSTTPQGGSQSSGLDDLLGIPASSNAPASSSDDFDPFDVKNLPPQDPSPYPLQSTAPAQVDDFDILGDLAKPVSELPPRSQPIPSPQSTPMPEHSRRPPSPAESDPRDPAIAEIMDMGFSAEQARRALAETDTGLDVEAAVSWLLEEAHKSRPTSAAPSQQNQSRQTPDESSLTGRTRNDDNVPAWAREGRSQQEKDLGAYAAEIGGTLFKSANTLWSTGRKKMERAVAEFKVDLADGGDPNQPKWMRERQIREELERRGARGITRNNRPPRSSEGEAPTARENQEAADALTDEAMMLEMGGGPPNPGRKQREDRAPTNTSHASPTTDLSDREQLQRQRQQQLEATIREKERGLRERERARASAIPDSASRKAKLTSDEPVYVSRNRRRPPPPPSAGPSKLEPDLLNTTRSNGTHSAPSSSLNRFARDVSAERSKPPTPIATPPPSRRRTPPQRPNIPLSPFALSQSTAARQKGTEAFKRGDYSAAHTFYTSSLSAIPDQHPLHIILLTNRALCTLKLGDPKSALCDIDTILTMIGDSRGEGETIPLDGQDKGMKEYWVKAVTRKAEALEQVEKWSGAKEAWELVISAGAGGAVAMNGKRRCEDAMRPKSLPSSKPKPLAPRRPPVPARTSNGGGDAAAVRALRAANAEQERQEAEKLELHDTVHERVAAWKNGKEGNLRALLAGLDTVLWEGSGWKKVGMGELLAPQKCKVAYMKGIAKVHPDKVFGLGPSPFGCEC